MLSISDGGSLARALGSSIDSRVKLLLARRRDQLGGDITGQAHFVIVQPADDPAHIERTVGFSLFENFVDGSRFGEPEFTPAWELLADHGFCSEIVFILDDSGFAHVVIVPKEDGVNAEFLALCRAYASEDA